jgi:hypothetical protein
VKFRYEVPVQDLCFILFEVSAVVAVRVDALCNVTPCSRESGYRCAIGAHCFCVRSLIDTSARSLLLLQACLVSHDDVSGVFFFVILVYLQSVQVHLANEVIKRLVEECPAAHLHYR